MTTITELRIADFKRLRAVDIRPNGALVEITGKNSAGKSSVLEAIFLALKGLAAAPPMPIRDGAERCAIHLATGEYIIDREFTRTEGGSYTHRLTVTRSDGTRVTSKPQDALSAVCGALAFDPLAFAKMKPQEQYDLLRGFVADFDFAANKSLRDSAYAERTDVNRRYSSATAAAQAIVLPPGPCPAPVEVADVIAELDAAREHNDSIAERAGRRQKAAEDIEAKRDAAERLRAKFNALEREADELEEKLAAAPPLPATVDVEPLKTKLSSADRVNATVRAFQAREAKLAEAADAKAASDALTARIEEYDRQKRDAIAAAKMPVDGLDLADGAVILNGQPFSQAGTAEKIATSTAIAMALNPTLKVILIDDGESLDTTSREALAKIAEDRGFQVWMARVDSSGQSGFVIEDGSLKA